MSTKSVNENIKRIALLEEACHCSRRVVVSETLVTATCLETGILKGKLTWYQNASNDYWHLKVTTPYGTFKEQLVPAAEEAQFISAIYTLFERMDQAWAS